MARPDGASGEEKGILPQAHAKKANEVDEADDPRAASVIAFPQVSLFLPPPIEAPHVSGQSRDPACTIQASVDAGGQSRDLVLPASVDAGIRLPEGTLAPLSDKDLGFVSRASGEEAVPDDFSGDPVAIEGAKAPVESGAAAVGADPHAKESARLPSDMRVFDAKKAASENRREIGENPQSKASAGLASGIGKGIDAKEAAPFGGSLDERSVVFSEPPRNGVRRADAPAPPMAQAPAEASSAAARNPRRTETFSAQTRAVGGDLPEKAAPRAMDDPTLTEDVAAPAVALAQSRPDVEAQGAERAQTAPRTDAPRAAPEPGPSAQLARSAVGALARGESQFHLRLRPEGMGEVAVTIRARERELSLNIRASSGETRELILSQIDDLRGGLATGDYRLGELSVEVNASGHGGAAFSTFAQDKGNREAPRQPVKPSQVAAAEVPDRSIQTRKGAILYRI